MNMVYTYDDATYSDLYKDARGTRPSADERRAWAAMTPDEKQVEWEALCCELDREQEREREGHDRAWNAWIDRMFELAATLETSVGDAIRQDVKAAEVGGDYGYYCFREGLSYDREAYIKATVENQG
jgi:predicted Fe-S protein YdhL (DUF1289 family)